MHYDKSHVRGDIPHKLMWIPYLILANKVRTNGDTG